LAKLAVSFTVNGEPQEILVQPWHTLLDSLRDELRFTGTKEGCGNGNCGACTVMFNGRAVNSCCILAVEAQGQEVVTIEGMARNGVLDPLQEAFITHDALQCGFCTPGMLLSARAFLDKNPHPSEGEIRLAIAGNLCRCTGYDKIVRAIQAVAKAKA
jgi:carbon-monoxide dehydrogenase small subunit